MRCKNCHMEIRDDEDDMYVHIETGIYACHPWWGAEPEEE